MKKKKLPLTQQALNHALNYYLLHFSSLENLPNLFNYKSN